MLRTESGVLAAVLLASKVAFAAPACDVAEPSDLDARWRDAAHTLAQWFRGRQDVDCGRVELRPEAPGARIVFTTVDGRRAERTAVTPQDVLPVVQALALTIPAESPPGQGRSDVRRAPVPPTGSIEGGEDPHAAHLPPGMRLEARTGLRVPGPAPCDASSSGPATCTFALVSLGLGVGVHVGPWDLGVDVAVAPAYATLAGASPAGLSMASYSAGVSAGRHAHAGSLDWVLGGAAGVLVTHASNGTDDENEHGQDQDSFSQVEPRVGIFAGLVLPPTGALRLRPELALDVIPTHLGRSWTAPDAPLPGLAWWTTSASLGVEWLAP